MSKVKQPTDNSTDVQPYEISELTDGRCYSTDDHMVVDFTEYEHNVLFLNRNTDTTTVSLKFDTVKIKGMSPDEVLDPYFKFHIEDVAVGSIDFDQISSELKELLMEKFL